MTTEIHSCGRPPGWDENIVGRGAREGARLFRSWFNELSEVAEQGGGAAYVFVLGSMNEVLKSFDLPVVFPEVNALQTAVRHVSEEYLNEAEDYGYSPDICGYVKADVAMQLRGGDHPMGSIPKPRLAVLTNGCNTYIKWAEIWERMYEVPAIVIDVPGTRAAGEQSQRGSEEFDFELAYVVGQIKELLAVCEKVTGTTFDIDRFREILGHANRLNAAYKTLLELNCNEPALFGALTDGTVYLGMVNCFRGEAEGGAYFEELVEEMTYRAERGIGILDQGGAGTAPVEQRFRLGFVGAPCYPMFRRFNDLFANWGGVFVASTYLSYASGGAPLGYEYDLANPLESYAEGVLLTVREGMDAMFHRARDIETKASKYNLDGVVYHPIKSCRTVSTGLADRRRHATEELGLSTLFFESDLIDPRVVSEAQMRNRVDAFFEGLVSRQQQASA
jgi:benzoyl-CoA reductase subunit B